MALPNWPLTYQFISNGAYKIRCQIKFLATVAIETKAFSSLLISKTILMRVFEQLIPSIVKYNKETTLTYHIPFISESYKVWISL